MEDENRWDPATLKGDLKNRSLKGIWIAYLKNQHEFVGAILGRIAERKKTTGRKKQTYCVLFAGFRYVSNCFGDLNSSNSHSIFLWETDGILRSDPHFV